MQAIHKNYRRIPIPRELLSWTDNDINNSEAVHMFFSDFTLNMLRISVPDDRAAKNVIEFISVMKSYSELMRRPQIIDSDINSSDFDRYMEFQNKRLDKIHARLFKLDAPTSNDAQRKKFREAMMMSIVSLKMLRKFIMTKYKNATFSTESITNELIRTKLAELTSKYNFKRVMAPQQLFRIIKDIFLGEDCSVKPVSDVEFFYSGSFAFDDQNVRNESNYVAALQQWIIDNHAKKYPDLQDTNELKQKLRKAEDTFNSTQNPNFRICEQAVQKTSRELVESNESMNKIVRMYIIQRHLLRIKYFNENQLTRITVPTMAAANSAE